MTEAAFFVLLGAAAIAADYFRPQAKARRAELRAAGVRGWWRAGLVD